jgi:hypothetical protein
MRLRDHGLTIVLLTATFLTIAGMIWAGQSVYNEELAKHGQLGVPIENYVVSGHFLSALFENWESEFLQMSAYVVLTAFLFQRGSAESRDPDSGDEPQDENPAEKQYDPTAPWAVKAGGVVTKLYSYSLGWALGGLFVLSFILHLQYSLEARNIDASLHGDQPTDIWAHLASADFWFESLQNWQSEFLSTAVIVVLSIFLRFKGSPESKPVAAPQSKTGAS